MFQWSAECETAFETLRTKLLTSPLLAYPNFSIDFTLETDASKFGLGAILSQYQDDQKLHPVAYGSRSTVQLNANLMTARGLQVENAQVNVHTRAGKDQGVRHGFTLRA